MNEPSGYKASTSLPRELAETIATAFGELFWPAPGAVGLIDNEDGTWRVELTFAGKPDTAALMAFLAEHGAKNARIMLEDIPEADWVAISQADLGPVSAGRFIIHGSYDRHLARRSRYAIEIDAGQAFGTAHHGSTLGCLRAIDDLAKREHMDVVLDIGTGTGVLAIAAAKVWRAQTLASDIDPVATRIAKENIRLNGMTGRIHVVTACGLDHPAIHRHGPYDLVLANILARPLIALAHDIAATLRPGGIVILSGITREQAGRVAAAYGAAGFSRLRQFTISDWVTLTLRRMVWRA